MNPIDKLLNHFTMYRLVVYVLAAYAALSIVFSFTGRLSASPTSLVVSLAIIVLAAYAVDRGLGRAFNVPTNMESSLITSLIIFLIVQPAHTFGGGLALAAAGAISSASKFLVARDGKHIFNPAAFAAAFLSLGGLQAVTWWIGSSIFWPFTLILGLAVVRKVRRFPLFLTFVAVSTALQFVLFLNEPHLLGTGMKHALIASPLIFLSTIMLTEPATMPPRRNLQIAFGAFVAFLYITAWQIGPLTIYPEVALLIGNVFAYAVSPKFRVRLQLKHIQKISDRVYNYTFLPEHRFDFLPGQFMEWTLAGVPYDSRGNRRSFTIASSPTESAVQLGVKFYEPASTYKATLEKLKPGDVVYASQLAGNFTLREHEDKKLAFIAGGIGITPFRSMLMYLRDKNIPADIVLLYAVGDPKEFAYIRDLKEAGTDSIKIIPIITTASHATRGALNAKLTAETIERLIPDYEERMFYVSGPNAMVDSTKRHLHDLGVYGARIKTDHFSGY